MKITDENVANSGSYTKSQAAIDARSALLKSSAGCLSTITRTGHELADYPMASVVPYTLDHQGNFIILISDIAEHTKNARKNTKASLIIRDTEEKDIQVGWRVTIVGDLQQVEDAEAEEVGQRYYRAFPNSKNYHQTHDFNFFRLIPKKFRYIKGFGKISWVGADVPLAPCPFSVEEEDRVIDHMNDDHQTALFTYLKQIGVEIAEGNQRPPQMVSVNQYGVMIRYERVLYFIAFSELAETTTAVRNQLVAMAKVT